MHAEAVGPADPAADVATSGEDAADGASASGNSTSDAVEAATAEAEVPLEIALERLVEEEWAREGGVDEAVDEQLFVDVFGSLRLGRQGRHHLQWHSRLLPPRLQTRWAWQQQPRFRMSWLDLEPEHRHQRRLASKLLLDPPCSHHAFSIWLSRL